MKFNNYRLRLPVFALLLSVCFSFSDIHSYNATLLNGAWELQGAGDNQEIAMFSDGYFKITSFNKAAKKLNVTYGGTYQLQGSQLTLTQEFNSMDKDQVGESATIPLNIQGNTVTVDNNGNTQTWKRLDNGTGPLAGVWRSGGRLEDGKVTFSPLGARKTFKMMTGGRFQWTAMNTETKEMLGTGGGTYSYVNGKYTENIEFFSRDSNTVGKSLVFDGKVENDTFFSSGLNSRGVQMSEIWGRVKL